MPVHNYARPRSLQREAIVIAGSFAPNGSSAVAAASNKGPGWSVARTSAGLFTLTFNEKYTELVSAVAALQLASGDDKAVQIGTWTQASKTLTIRVWDTSGGAETDVSANANNRINFVCVFRKTAMVPTRG